MKATIRYLLFFLLLTRVSHAQVVSVSSGNWNTASTWSTGTVPGASDDVIIRHAVSISNSSFSSTVKSLTLENGTLDATATLSFNSGSSARSLHILNDLTVSATSNNNCRVNLQGPNTMAQVDGDILLIRDHSGTVSAFGIALRDGSSVTGTNLTVDYRNSGDDNQEVYVRETSSMILSGDVLLKNSGGLEEPSLDVVDDAYFECNNLTALLTLPEAPSGVGRDTEVRVWDNGRLVIHGDFNLSRTGGRRINVTIGKNSPAAASILVEGNMYVEHLNGLDHTNKDLPITAIDQSSLTVRGNLAVYSSSERAIEFNFSGNSQLDVDGIVSLTGTTNTNLELNAYNNSKFFFGDDIIMNFPSLPNPNLFYFASSGSNISTVTFDGITNQTVPGMETYGNLIINNPNWVTLAGDITVSTSLEMNSGRVKATSKIVTLPLGASITGSSNSYICNGKLSRGLSSGPGPYWFYVGDTAKGYSPVVLDNLSATSTFEVKYFHEYPGSAPSPGPYPPTVKEAILDKVTTLEYWIIDRTAGTGTAQVTLGWNENSAVSYAHLDKLRITRWDGTQWTDLGTTTYTGDATAGLVTTTATVNNFSPFTLASTVLDHFIPLANSVLKGFSVQAHDNRILISWQSSAHTDQARFLLERSGNGRHFELLDSIPADNPGHEFITYTYPDNQLLPCKTYYRVQQLNMDGSSIMSQTIVMNSALTGRISLYPNPVTSNSTAFLKMLVPDCSGKLNHIRIIDINGKVVYNRKTGNDYTLLPIGRLGLHPGLYRVLLWHEYGMKTEWLLVK